MAKKLDDLDTTTDFREPEQGAAKLDAMGVPNYHVGGRMPKAERDWQPGTPAPSAAPAAQPAGLKVDTLKNGRVPMEDGAGELWSFPRETASEAVKSGYKPISADDFTARKTEKFLREKYGHGAVEQAKAVGEGALNGLIADSGDALLSATGIEPKEAILAHRKYMKVARGAGEVATIAGSAVTGEGEASAAEHALQAEPGAAEAAASHVPEGAAFRTESGHVGPLKPEALPGEHEVTPDQVVGTTDLSKPSPGQNYEAGRRDLHPTQAEPSPAFPSEAEETVAGRKARGAAPAPSGEATPVVAPPPAPTEPATQIVPPPEPEATVAGRKNAIPTEPIRGGASSADWEAHISGGERQNAAQPPMFRGVAHAIPPPEPRAGFTSTAAEEATHPVEAPTQIEDTAVSAPPPAPAPGPEPVSAPAAPAAGPGPDTIRKAWGVATAPNRAIFGMGKSLGADVEAALGGGTLGKAGGMFARGAAESVPFTVGGNLSDAELNGDPLTPERLAAGMGVNALLGGSLSTGLGLAAHGLDKMHIQIPDLVAERDPLLRARTAAQSFDQAYDGVEQAVRGVYVPDASGLSPKYQRVAQILNGSTNVIEGRAGPSWGALNDATSRFVDAVKSAKGAVPDALREAHARYLDALSKAPDDAGAFQAADQFKQSLSNLVHEELKTNFANREFANALDMLKKRWIAGLEDRTVWGQAGTFQHDLNDLMEQYVEQNNPGSPLSRMFRRRGVLEGEPGQMFDEGRMLKWLDDLHSENPASRGRAELQQKVLKEWMDAHRRLVGFLQDDVHSPLGRDRELTALHDTLGGHDDQLAATIADMRDLSDSQKRSVLQRAVSDRGTRLGAAGMLLTAGVPHAFLLTYTTSYALDKLIGLGLGHGFGAALADHAARFTATLKQAVQDAFDGSSQRAGAAVGILKSATFSPNEQPDKKDRLGNATERIAKVVSDPTTVDRVAASTHALQIAHPEMAAQVQAQTMRALGYLHDQAPKDPLPPGLFPSPVPYKPGHAESARFENVAEVVVDPLCLVRDFGNGSLTREQVATADAVWPELTNAVREEVMHVAQSRGADLDYRQKLALGRLIGQPIDWASQPDGVQALQALHAEPKPGGGDMSKGGSANKPRKSTSAKQAESLAQQQEPGLQSALSAL